MPSLWQWLCCSRRRFASRKDRRRQKTLADRQSAYIVRTHEDSLVNESSGHAQSDPTSSSHSGSEPVGGGVDANGNNVMQKLLEAENNRNRKRRRADEIFRHQSAPESAPAGDLFRLRDRVFKSDSSLSENDKMYGYVPRAIQGMFVSTALEGYKVEDYLPNSKTNRDIDRFCSLPAVSSNSSNNNGNTPRPANSSQSNSNHSNRRQDNGLRSNNARLSSNGVPDNDDDVFPVTQRQFNLSRNVTSVPPRFLSSAVTNLDDIDVVLEMNADDVLNMDNYANDVTKSGGGATDFSRNGVGRESNTEWLPQTRKKLVEPEGLTVNSDIENIFSCDGEVLY